MQITIFISILFAIGREIPLLYLLISNFIPGGDTIFACVLLVAIIIKKIVYTFSNNYINVAIIREVPLFILIISCLCDACPLLMVVEAMVAFWIEDMGDYVVESLLLSNVLDDLSEEDMDDLFK